MSEEKFNYNEFFNEVENSLTLMAYNMNKCVYEAPNIHNKILRRLTIERNTLQKIENEYNRIFGQKFHYYRYEYELKLDNKDVVMFYVKKDEEFLKINDKFNKQKLLVDTIEKWMKKAQNTAFEIKNIVEYLKWSSGA